MYTLQVHITKELVEKSKMCGFTPDGKRSTDEDDNLIPTTCLFALAFRDIFPNAWVDADEVYPFGIPGPKILLPEQAVTLIWVFDMLGPSQRVESIQEEIIDIPIPDYILEKLDISEVTKQLQSHPTLKLMEVKHV